MHQITLFRENSFKMCPYPTQWEETPHPPHPSTPTIRHPPPPFENAFTMFRVDYCNAVLASVSKVVTNMLQLVLNAATRVTDTRLVSASPHWLDIPE